MQRWRHVQLHVMTMPACWSRCVASRKLPLGNGQQLCFWNISTAGSAVHRLPRAGSATEVLTLRVPAQLVLHELLNPRTWQPSEERRFALDAEQIARLCDAAENVFRGEPSILRLHGEASSVVTYKAAVL